MVGKKPTRKLTPFIHDANKIAGRNEVLMGQPDNDIAQEDFSQHGHNGKTVRAIRKQIRAERDQITSRARARIKNHDRKELENLE